MTWLSLDWHAFSPMYFMNTSGWKTSTLLYYATLLTFPIAPLGAPTPTNEAKVGNVDKKKQVILPTMATSRLL
jgi:hypothetical protein